MARRFAPAFEGVDCVFHVAALPRIPLSIAKPVETHMTNVVGTLNVLIAARDAKVRRVIYSGSSSVYGDQTAMPLVETMAPNPLNPYALQKYVGEQYARMFHRLFAMETLTLRYFNVYGPRMAPEGAYVMVISAFLAARRTRRPLEIHGDGEQTRDFTHVSDVVAANILAMDAKLPTAAPSTSAAATTSASIESPRCSAARSFITKGVRARCGTRWRIARERSRFSDGARNVDRGRDEADLLKREG